MKKILNTRNLVIAVFAFALLLSATVDINAQRSKRARRAAAAAKNKADLKKGAEDVGR